MYRTFVISVLLLFSICSRADKIQVAIGIALPPYVIQETNNGIELDIVRESLALVGHELTPLYIPLKRMPLALSAHKVDAAMTMVKNNNDDIYYSEPYIRYENAVISLLSNNLQISSINDLEHLSIIAFQNASSYLGAEFAAMVASNNNYREVANQTQQVYMLYRGRTEVVVMDVNIFNYYRQSAAKLNTNLQVRTDHIFPFNDYRMGFQSQRLRDDFNKGLNQLVASGGYQKILERYNASGYARLY